MGRGSVPQQWLEPETNRRKRPLLILHPGVYDKEFIHGQPVCLGIFVGSCMGNNHPDWILDIIHKAGVEIRPEGMGITWEDVFAAIKYEKEFLESHDYWYTVVNDFEVTDEFCQMVKDKVIAKYGEWEN